MLKYSDIYQALVFYDQIKGLKRKLQGDQADIVLLRPFAIDIDMELNDADLFEVIKVIINNTTEQGHASSVVIDTLSTIIGAELLGSLTHLYEKGILTQTNFYAVKNHANPREVAKALVHLNRAHIITQPAFNVVIKYVNPIVFADVLGNLDREQMLTQANFDMAFKNHANPFGVAQALEHLNNAGMLTQVNFDAVTNHENPFGVAQALVRLKREYLLDRVILDAVKSHASPLGVARALEYLYESQMLNQANIDVVKNNDNPFGVAEALVKLIRANLFDQVIFDVVKNHEQPYAAAKALLTLNRAGILNQANIDVVKNHKKQYKMDQLLNVLERLNEAHILNQANFDVVTNHTEPVSTSIAVVWLYEIKLLTQSNLAMVKNHTRIDLVTSTLSRFPIPIMNQIAYLRDLSGSSEIILNHAVGDVFQHCQQAEKIDVNKEIDHFYSIILKIPELFSYAEMHQHEFGTYVQNFIQNTLQSLREEKQTQEAANPNAIFNIPNEEANLYFYIIRHFIRSNDPTLHDSLLLLMEIPAVKALLHTNNNELLRLAVSIGNRDAAELLLNIPAVLQLAVQNNYYPNEARGQFNLTEIARDRESSMRALSTDEQQLLTSALKHYQPMIKAASEKQIFNSLLDTLKERYKKNPAKIVKDNSEDLTLPLTWHEFEQLQLSQSERKAALKAYYQHTDHSAWRYLNKPNYWMAENAAYVEVNPHNHRERWSTFEEYIPLISLFWLAANDGQISPTDGYTLESRIDNFIKELSLIGRAHNWDKTRVKAKDVEEEYDDQEGDKPSCFSGVKRRLFQSVQGHKLLKMLTLDDLKQEVRDFMRQYFIDRIAEKGDEIKAAYIDYLTEFNPDALVKLKKLLDVTTERQSEFVAELSKKYGVQFNNDYEKYVTQEFKLTQNNECHAIKFGYVGLYDLLNKYDSSNRTSNQGLFAKSSSSSSSSSSLSPSKNILSKNDP